MEVCNFSKHALAEGFMIPYLKWTAKQCFPFMPLTLDQYFTQLIFLEFSDR